MKKLLLILTIISLVFLSACAVQDVDEPDDFEIVITPEETVEPEEEMIAPKEVVDIEAVEDIDDTIIDDYGHHPVEIAAVLKAARQATAHTEGARVIAVHQPHRYSRLHSLFDDFCACFNDADVVGVAEVFAAGEDVIEGATQDDLVAGLIRHGHRHARAVTSEEDLVRLVKEQAKPGDMVVCLGAGTIL